MASRREQKKADLYGMLHQLGRVTNSTSENETSIVADASKYIEELKEKVDRFDLEAGSSAEVSDTQNSSPMVTVEVLDKGFLINVSSNKNRPNMLVNVLEAIEELGLEVHDARVSCVENFHLEAVGQENKESSGIDSQVVKQAVLQAITSTSVQD